MSEPESIRVLYMEDDVGLARLLQKKLQQAVIDTVLAKISIMSSQEKKQYLDDFENWLSSYH